MKWPRVCVRAQRQDDGNTEYWDRSDVGCGGGEMRHQVWGPREEEGGGVGIGGMKS